MLRVPTVAGFESTTFTQLGFHVPVERTSCSSKFKVLVVSYKEYWFVPDCFARVCALVFVMLINLEQRFISKALAEASSIAR